MDMAVNSTWRKALVVTLILLLTAAVTVSAWGCGKAEPVEPGGQEEQGEDAGKGEDEGEPRTFTLYFRYNDGEREWLFPEERTVSEVNDPYVCAMQELIAGPAPGSQLFAVLPDTVKVLDVEVADGVCTVDLSKEILTDASQVGAGAAGEGLALAAIADTLTELEGVERVRLLVEGMQSGMIEGRFVEDFWGHMGLPEYLERNEELIYIPN